VPSTSGGRMPSLEVLVNTGRVSERIEDPNRTSEIHDVIVEGEFYGMCTFDQSLVHLVAAGKVTPAQAMDAASNPHDFELALKQAGVIDPSATLQH
jgi:twitching motility protein PilT